MLALRGGCFTHQTAARAFGDVARALRFVYQCYVFFHKLGINFLVIFIEIDLWLIVMINKLSLLWSAGFYVDRLKRPLRLLNTSWSWSNNYLRLHRLVIIARLSLVVIIIALLTYR